MLLSEKTIAPDFELADESGKLHKLSDYRGKPVLLYFYPKDDTPGCTTEACSFRDAFADYTKAGVVILGSAGIL
jgi:peroxiredoxin Q/BCP